ncbi:unnamed protein product [Hermetia illucens]|uniref:Prostaglandin reductase 1 n=1 Tax=Hermetia illucens TaxID=343691 RepID=A0A7R8UEM3_HERIL|nr:unnamed protein product [Hermetia illucens]
MVIAKKILYAKQFEGEPTPSNFRLETEKLPALGPGEILCEAEYLSVDPYMRPYMSRYPVNSVMIGGQVAKVIESNNPKYPVGFSEGSVENSMSPDEVTRLDDFEGLPYSLGVGYLGMPGSTAYFGFLEICKPKAGEVVVVTGAAGVVGSLVGQIAKIKGCKVIGFAGSDEKCIWLKEELGFDYAFNYKTCDVGKSLNEAAPTGVDCYFDNVGGEISSMIMSKMNKYGRISVCGSISVYNDTKIPLAPVVQPYFISNELKMEGFLVHRWKDRFSEAVKAVRDWIKEGKVKYRETATKGFENMPQAFMDMLKGKNLGKAVVQA